MEFQRKTTNCSIKEQICKLKQKDYKDTLSPASRLFKDQKHELFLSELRKAVMTYG